MVRPEIEKKQLSVRRLAQGMVTVRSPIYPSTNSTGRSAESIKELIVLILSATLLRLMSPSTLSWSRETVSSRNVPRYLFIRYRPALFLKASEKLVYHADHAMVRVSGDCGKV